MDSIACDAADGRLPSKRRLKCVGIDDDALCRAMQSMMFEVFLDADMTASVSLGAGEAEVEHFLDVAMGRRGIDFLPVEGEAIPADVVVIDQNMRFNSDRTGEPVDIYGTDLVLKLREGGFRGVACIFSGGGSVAGTIDDSPGVDLAFEKGAPLKEMSACIQRTAEARMRREGRATDGDSRSVLACALGSAG